jgi:hypothetical protein
VSCSGWPSRVSTCGYRIGKFQTCHKALDGRLSHRHGDRGVGRVTLEVEYTLAQWVSGGGGGVGAFEVASSNSLANDLHVLHRGTAGQDERLGEKDTYVVVVVFLGG